MNETDFMKEYNAIFERSLLFAILARQMGLAVFKNAIDEKKRSQRDIFEYGMHMVISARPPELIDKIFNNLINLEQDKERKILKNMQRDAVFAIQKGENPECLMWILNSYVNIELDKAEAQYKEIDEFVMKSMEKEAESIRMQAHYYDIYEKIGGKVVDEFYNERNIKQLNEKKL